MFGRILRVLDRVERKLDAVATHIGVMMSKEEDLQADLDAEKTDLDAIAAVIPTVAGVLTDQQTTIAALTRRIDELTAGQPVTQLQLDNLTGEANTLKMQSDGIVSALQSLVVPPAPVPQNPSPAPPVDTTGGTTATGTGSGS